MAVRIFSRFDTIHERDGRTAHDGIGRAYACVARQLRTGMTNYRMEPPPHRTHIGPYWTASDLN